MKFDLIIFNGIKFPYYLMEYSLAQAKKDGASVHVLFLKRSSEISEGYGYPSDLEAAEELTNREDSEKDDLNILNEHMKLAIDMAATEGVTCTTEHITDCTLEQILRLVKNFDAIYIDADYDDENSDVINNTKFSLKDLTEQSPITIQLVSEDTQTDKNLTIKKQ